MHNESLYLLFSFPKEHLPNNQKVSSKFPIDPFFLKIKLTIMVLDQFWTGLGPVRWFPGGRLESNIDCLPFIFSKSPSMQLRLPIATIFSKKRVQNFYELALNWQKNIIFLFFLRFFLFFFSSQWHVIGGFSEFVKLVSCYITNSEHPPKTESLWREKNEFSNVLVST